MDALKNPRSFEKSSSKLILTVQLIFVCHACIGWSFKYKPKQQRCEKIEVSLCDDIRYNTTRMPNSFGHSNQREASEAIEEFLPLIRIGCSDLLRFFLCSRFVPICSEQEGDSFIVPPCMSLCMQVKTGCAPVLAKFSFNWPPSLDCHNLPLSGDTYNVCVEPPSELEEAGKLNKQHDFFEYDEMQRKKLLEGQYGPEITHEFDWLLSKMNLQSKLTQDSTCQSPRYVEAIDTKDKVCVPRCQMDVMFGQRDKEIIKTWLTLWSVVSVFSCAFTILSYLSRASDFKYPEKPVLYVAVCCASQSAVYAARLLVDGKLLHCSQDGRRLISGDVSNWVCTAFAVVHYYFDIAGLLWWIFLSFSWFLAAVRKWGQEAISSLGVFFHLVAWFVPGLVASAVVTSRNVEGDELLGMCKVSSRRSFSVLIFSVLPFIFSLAVGCVFTIAGFVSVFRVLRQLKTSYSVDDATRLERLIFRMGIFSVLYITTGISQLICHVVRFVSLDGWILESMYRPCHGNWEEDTLNCRLDRSIAPTEIYLVQIFASLSVGVTTTTWVWSKKTLINWGRLFSTFCSKIFFCRVARRNETKSAEVKQAQTTRHSSKNASPIPPNHRCHPSRPTRAINSVSASPVILINESKTRQN